MLKKEQSNPLNTLFLPAACKEHFAGIKGVISKASGLLSMRAKREDPCDTQPKNFITGIKPDIYVPAGTEDWVEWVKKDLNKGH